MSTVTVTPSADLAALLGEISRGSEVALETGGTVVARLVPAARASYVGLYGNHPYQVAARHPVCTRELRPEDFED